MKYAVFTCGVNVNYLDITIPFMKSYCNTHNFDFILNQELKYPNFNSKVHGAFERYALYDLLNDYDRILYVDTDIIIKKNSPNIFNIVPENQLGVYHESDDFDLNYFINLLKPKYNFRGITRYFNSGVLVVSKIHKPLFDMQKVEEFFKNVTKNTLADQDYLNIYTYVNNIPVYSLSYKFNYLIRPFILKNFDSAHFVHFAGCRNKKVLMKKFLLQHPCED